MRWCEARDGPPADGCVAALGDAEERPTVLGDDHQSGGHGRTGVRLAARFRTGAAAPISGVLPPAPQPRKASFSLIRLPIRSTLLP
ncbi:hypothetical protein GCM10017567_10290 [Amycolatopsis bullii]|uniref:Uncharacterized protein n=1 Tax=Amycolatopsis bullii TaxID=941987 RepID=A0ABQ3JZT0_9PSEU|nr:hypothetical protein GCM10017567_10290 [Amycolatopsis bullii]